MTTAIKSGPAATVTTRVFQDVATMLSAILLHDPSQGAAAVLDPLIRPELTRRYAALPAHVRQTVEARAKKARAAKLAASKQPA